MNAENSNAAADDADLDAALRELGIGREREPATSPALPETPAEFVARLQRENAELQRRCAEQTARIAQLQLPATPAPQPVAYPPGIVPSRYDNPAERARMHDDAARRRLDADRNYYGFAPPLQQAGCDWRQPHHETPEEAMHRMFGSK